MQFFDTIFALSSGHLPSGVAVIRISGEKVRFVCEMISGAVPEPRRALYRPLKDRAGTIIDHGLLLFFNAPASFTGEDVAEFHLHGGKAVVAAFLALLSSFDDCRHAEAGEFTRRAFLNGKMDLLGAEAVADLISAETEAQRRLAISNASGVQSVLYREWRQRLIHARAMIEAEMDFSDEADIPGSISASIWADLRLLSQAMAAHIASFRQAEIIRDGLDVVIVGAPNAGKSSLLNALASREAAIVTDEPGTTRDLVEVVLDIDGMKVRVTDTAGLREKAGKVETLGIAKARARAELADVILHMRDISSAAPDGVLIKGARIIKVGSKADLPHQIDRDEFHLLVSCEDGSGLEALRSLLAAEARKAVGNAADVLPSRMRHVELLTSALESLLNAVEHTGEALELRAEELRSASDHIGRISGAVDVEDLLDVIFSQFCVGK